MFVLKRLVFSSGIDSPIKGKKITTNSRILEASLALLVIDHGVAFCAIDTPHLFPTILKGRSLDRAIFIDFKERSFVTVFLGAEATLLNTYLTN